MGDPIGSYSRPAETWCLAGFRGLMSFEARLSPVSELPTMRELFQPHDSATWVGRILTVVILSSCDRGRLASVFPFGSISE